MREGQLDFVLVDVRSEEKYREAHMPGAIHMLVGKMARGRLAAWPEESLFVVYCAGPHCNGTDKAALPPQRAGPPDQGDDPSSALAGVVVQHLS